MAVGEWFSKGELGWLAVTVFFVPFVHLLGLLLAGLGAYEAYTSGRRPALFAFALLAVVSAALEIAAL